MTVLSVRMRNAGQIQVVAPKRLRQPERGFFVHARGVRPKRGRAASAGMRRIDLTCLIVSPIFAGVLMTYAGSRTAVLAVLAWNLAACAPECLLAAHVVRCSRGLQCAHVPAALCLQGKQPQGVSCGGLL